MPSTQHHFNKHFLAWTLRVLTLPLVVYPIFIQADTFVAAVFIVPVVSIFIVWHHLATPLRFKNKQPSH